MGISVKEANSIIEQWEKELFINANDHVIDYISECYLNSVSSIITVKNHNQKIFINGDDYGTRQLAIFILLNTDEQSEVYIDGKDIFDWN